MNQLATFRIGDEVFGINLLLTKEISRIHDITSVPEAPKFVSGLMNLRGQIVTVIKPALIMGMEEKEVDDSSRLVILKTRSQAEILLKRGLIDDVAIGEDTLALLIDDVGDHVEYEDVSLAPAPPHIKEKHRDLVAGVVQMKGELVVVLNLEKLIHKIKEFGETN